MAIDIDILIDELVAYAPNGVELPKNPDDNQIRTETLTRWAEEGSRKINERRQKTTIKETTISLVEDTQEYDLPSDCRDVINVKRQHSTSSVLDVPVAANVFGLRYGVMLPSGQQVDAGLDLINRQQLAREQCEDDYEIFGGKLKLLFPIDAAEDIIVRYRAISASLDTIPDDYFNKLLTYMRFRLLDWYVGRHGVNISQDGSVFGQEAVVSYRAMRNDLERQWLSELNSIGAEAN